MSGRADEGNLRPGAEHSVLLIVVATVDTRGAVPVQQWLGHRLASESECSKNKNKNKIYIAFCSMSDPLGNTSARPAPPPCTDNIHSAHNNIPHASRFPLTFFSHAQQPRQNAPPYRARRGHHHHREPESRRHLRQLQLSQGNSAQPNHWRHRASTHPQLCWAPAPPHTASSPSSKWGSPTTRPWAVFKDRTPCQNGNSNSSHKERAPAPLDFHRTPAFRQQAHLSGQTVQPLEEWDQHQPSGRFSVRLLSNMDTMSGSWQ